MFKIKPFKVNDVCVSGAQLVNGKYNSIKINKYTMFTL